MFVVTVVLAVVLLTGGSGDDSDSPAAVLPTSTPLVATATSMTEPPATPVPPSPTPPPPLALELQQRVDALPERLRVQTLSAYESGALSLEQLTQIVMDYENRNPAVRVGTVIGIEDAVLRFEVFTTGEEVEVGVVEETLVQRDGTDIALADLLPSELVMVVSTDEGATALTIEAFGVAAP